MSKFIQGITVQIGGDTSGLQKSFQQVNKDVTTVQSKLRTLNQALKLDPSNTELLSQKYQILGENVQKTETRLNNLKDLQKQFIDAGGDKMSKEYIELERQIAVCEDSLKKAKKQQDEFNVSIEKAKVHFDNVSKATDDLAKKTEKASLVASGGLLAMATASVKFEDAWAGVTKTVEGSDEQLASIRQGIFDLSKETASSAEDIAQVAENAGQLGIATDDVLEFTKVMIMLGDTTNLSADEASSALARFANITKTSSADYERLGSTIVALGNSSASTESEIVEMSTRLASAGTLAGLSEQQILALATALSSVGIEAEAGGSAMSKLIKQIQVSVETGNKDLENFAKVANMSMSDFSDLFEKDATKALLAFLEGLTDVERNGKSAIAILEDMGITEVRMSNAVLSMASNTDVLSDAINTANTAWDENTAMQEEAEKRYGTTQTKLIQAKNAIIEAGVALGDTLLPMIKGVAEAVADFGKWLADLDPKLQQVIVGTTGLVAVASPLFKMISNISGGLSALSPLLSKVVNLLPTTQSSMQGILGTGMQMPSMFSGWAGSVGLVVGALGGFALLLTSINSEYNKNLAAINEEINAFNELKDAQNEQYQSQELQLEQIAYLKSELDGLVDTNGRIKEGYEDRANYIINELQSATGIEIQAVDGVITKYDELSESIGKVILQQQAKNAMDKMQPIYDEAVQKSTEARIKLKEEEAQMEQALAQETKLANDLKAQYGDNYLLALQEDGSMIAQQLLNEYNNLHQNTVRQEQEYNAQKALVDDYTNTIVTYENNLLLMQEGNAESLRKIKESEVEIYAGTAEEKKEYLESQIANEKAKLDELTKKYNETGEKTYAESIEMSKNNIQTWESMLDDITNSIEDETPDAETAAKNLASAVAKGISSTDFYKKGKTIGKDFSDGFKLNAGSLVSYGYGLGTSIIGSLRDAMGIHSPSTEAEEIGYYFDKGLAIGLDSGQVTKQIEEMNKQLKSSIDFGQIDTSFSSVPIYIQNTLTLDGKVVSQSVVKHITRNQALRTQFKGG